MGGSPRTPTSTARRRAAVLLARRPTQLTAEEVAALRAKWHHEHGVTNVWRQPAVRGRGREKPGGGNKSLHTNQKPSKLMERIIAATSDPGDVVWEPSAASPPGPSRRSARGDAFAAEHDPEFFALATERLAAASATLPFE